MSAYFSGVANTLSAPVSGYKVNGRGYPDVSLAGTHYMVAIGGGWYSVSGTSASAPAVAGMFSLINAARIGQGKTSLGWVNPTLYSYYPAFTNDIKSGKNNCVVGASTPSTCCSQGYYATPGWDPATGLGSLNFLAMKTLMTNLGPILKPVTSSPTTSPTVSPTVSPTKTPTKSPTKTPTKSLTAPPSRRSTTNFNAATPTVKVTPRPNTIKE